MTDIVQKTRSTYAQGKPSEAQNIAMEAAKTATPDELLSIAALAKEFSDFDAANAAYAQLVKLTPDNPDYRNLYAMTLTQAGAFEAATTQLNEALTANAAHAHSYFHLSMIHRATTGDPIIARLEDHLRGDNIPPPDNYAYRLALGKFYDDTGDYDNAFIQIQKAKQSAKIPYDHSAQQAFFERLKTAFTPDAMESHAGVGNQSEAPIFVVGLPRSGSSLIEKLLARDKRITALGERIEMTSVIEVLVSRHRSKEGYLKLLPNMTADEFAECGADYCDRLASLSNGAERFIDKNLFNFLRAGFINLTLPKATIIHARRDPIDTCLSCYFQTLDPAIFPFTFDLSDMGKYYALYADLMAYWDSVMPDRVIHIDYEDVVADPDGSITKLIEETKLSCPLQLDDGDTKESMIATSSAWQARQPIYGTSVKHWKNYEKHLSPLLEALENSGFDYSGK